jgi:hypothetical protein
MSALGEPLKAEVELVAEKNEVGSLAVHLASREAFRTRRIGVCAAFGRREGHHRKARWRRTVCEDRVE